ncbi:unnamed protein product [Boreogadus saida]
MQLVMDGRSFLEAKLQWKMCAMRRIHLATQTSRGVCYVGPTRSSPVPCSKPSCDMRPAREFEGSINNIQPSITIKVNVLMDGFNHMRPRACSF